MIGITLTADQLRAAPAEVRQWIEREVIAALGLPVQPSRAEAAVEPQLASCSVDEVAAILAQIQGVLPAVNVLFELGRQGAMIPQTGVGAFRLIDIAHHTRLQNIAQVITCLDLITEALRRVRGDANAAFCGFDRDGHCFVDVDTQRNIFRLWQNVIAGQRLAAGRQPAATDPPVPPFEERPDAIAS
jgi:hypothetical protein